MDKTYVTPTITYVGPDVEGSVDNVEAAVPAAVAAAVAGSVAGAAANKALSKVW